MRMAFVLAVHPDTFLIHLPLRYRDVRFGYQLKLLSYHFLSVSRISDIQVLEQNCLETNFT